MPTIPQSTDSETKEQDVAPPTVQSVVRSENTSLPDNASQHPENGTDLEAVPTLKDEITTESTVRPTLTTTSSATPLHSVFTTNQKRFIIFMASWGGFFSAVSSNIYFPALNTIAHDLHVSNGLINLTLTSYMIFQGLAPAFVGDLADATGRRPAYAFCFVVYIAACIGLALQNSYAALFLLRCLQSTGSSATIALSSAVVSDVATASERGQYMGFVAAGALLGARTVVGNGSIQPKGINMSLMDHLGARRHRREHTQDASSIDSANTSPKIKWRFPNPLSSVPIILDKENAIVLLMNAFLFAAFYDITATIPSLYQDMYGFNDLQIGLCYIPFGVGACCAALSNGKLLDTNFLRWARKTGLEIKRGRQQDLRYFPIEKARLQIAFPGFYVSAVLILIYGWVIDVNGPLAVVLIILFFSSYSLTVSFNVSSTLLIDFYPHSPATATAANNLFRCLLGAGATGVIQPMLNGMGRGWTFTFLALYLVASSPLLWLVYFRGMEWREERNVRDERKKKEREEEKGGHLEEGCDRRRTEGTGTAPIDGEIVELRDIAEKEKEAAGTEGVSAQEGKSK